MKKTEEAVLYQVADKERTILVELEQAVGDAQARYLASINFIIAREGLEAVDRYDVATGAFYNVAAAGDMGG